MYLHFHFIELEILFLRKESTLALSVWHGYKALKKQMTSLATDHADQCPESDQIKEKQRMAFSFRIFEQRTSPGHVLQSSFDHLISSNWSGLQTESITEKMKQTGEEQGNKPRWALNTSVKPSKQKFRMGRSALGFVFAFSSISSFHFYGVHTQKARIPQLLPV